MVFEGQLAEHVTWTVTDNKDMELQQEIIRIDFNKVPVVVRNLEERRMRRHFRADGVTVFR